VASRVTSRPVAASVNTPPSVPIRLMMALPLLRRGLGVTSGMSATAGERYTPIARSSSPSATTNSHRLRAASATGSRFISTTAASVPPRI